VVDVEQDALRAFEQNLAPRGRRGVEVAPYRLGERQDEGRNFLITVGDKKKDGPRKIEARCICYSNRG